jgi:hypothetical protein
LVRWDTLLVLNLRLDVVDGVRRLDFESDGLPGQSLHEDLYAATEKKDKVKGRLLLVRKSAAVFELLAGEDEMLLVRRDTLLVLDFRLDVVDGVG